MIGKVTGFENLIPDSALNRDSDGDGIVDGYVRAAYNYDSVEFLFDPVEGAQMINHFGNPSEENRFDGLLGDFFPIDPEKKYTLHGKLKVEYPTNPETMTSYPRINMFWYTADKKSISAEVLRPNGPGEWQWIYRTNIQPPENAVFGRAKLEFFSRPGFEGGTAWIREIQLEEGEGIPTRYEETDFFKWTDRVGNNPGWKQTNEYKILGQRGYAVSGKIGDGEFAKSSLSFSIPPEADQINLTFWADTSRLNDESELRIYRGDSDLNPFPHKTLKKETEPQQVTLPVQRGVTRIDFVYAQIGEPVEDETPVLDEFTVTWEKVEPEPEPELPQGFNRSYILNFDEEYPEIFKVREKVEGYNHGFKRTSRQRKSGYYCFGVENPDGFSDGEKAGGAIEFSIPQTARNARMSFNILFRCQTAVARVLLNGDLVAELSEDTGGWVEISAVPLAGGNTLLIEYEVEKFNFDFFESIYIDDVIVSYDLARHLVMLIGTAPETKITTELKKMSVVEGFENTGYDSFFKVTNPGNLKSDGGGSRLPEAGWERTTKIARKGKYSMKAKFEKLKGTEDAAIDFTVRVPYGAKKPVFRVWNYVETRRSTGPINGEKYPRLFNEFRIWVNGSLWKEFAHASPELTRSVKYSAYKNGDPANDHACPYGRWWSESFYMTPGKVYTVSFESQLKNVPSGVKTTTGKNIMAIDDIEVYWDETPGNVIATPVEPLIYLDNRDGYRWVDERGGAEMPPISFIESETFGQPGSLYQATKIEPRIVDFPVRITANSRERLREKVRYLTSQIANRPLGLQILYPEGEERTLICRFSADPIWTENRETNGTFWRKMILSFRAFDPFWYGKRVEVEDTTSTMPKWVLVSNDGDFPAWPVIKVYGPIANAKLTLTRNSPESTIESESMMIEYVVQPGRHIVIDPRPGQKVVMLDDGTSIFGYMTLDSKLFSIPNGDFGIKLEGAATSEKTKLEVEYMTPYWGV